MTGAPPYVGRVVVTPRRQRLATVAQVYDGAGEITRRGVGATLRVAQQVGRVAEPEVVAVQGVPPQDVGRRPRRLTVGQKLHMERDGVAAAGRPVIPKLYGAIDRSDSKRDSYVVTENSYIDCLSGGGVGDQSPFRLRERMADSHFRFLGHSMRAWSLRVFVNGMWGAERLDLKSWTVRRESGSAVAREIEEALWRDRGEVQLLYVELNECVERFEVELSAAVAE